MQIQLTKIVTVDENDLPGLQKNHIFAGYFSNPADIKFCNMSRLVSIRSISIRLILMLAAMLSLMCSCDVSDQSFYDVRDGRFVKDGKEIYFIGANMWYGALMASSGPGGDRQRLAHELDSLKSMGITNLRVLVGAEGEEGTPYKVAPVLQKAPGQYDTVLLEGLDYFMSELGRRGMTAVLYLNNTWEWSGGYGTYLEWAGAGKCPLPVDDGWDAFRDFAAQFVTNDKAKAMFADHVRAIVSRTNTVTGVSYKNDPAIFSWQICNEPRSLDPSDSSKTAFRDWIWSTAALIKSIDPNHMVSTGSEGYYGCEVDMDLFEQVHSCPDIDYLNIHVWPYNWRWVDKDNLTDSTSVAIELSDKYIDMHLATAQKLGKPIVIEEFGYPRNGLGYSKDVPVTARDIYYSHMFGRLLESAAEKGVIGGVNFWAWGGSASQSAEKLWWHPGDEFCGDPAQEPQGFYSVYSSDTSTINVIRNAESRLSELGYRD